jgi:hypothetical protein
MAGGIITSKDGRVSSGSFSLPPRMEELWPWVVAGVAFDNGDTKPLAKMIRTEPIPSEYMGMVADIVRGERKPNLKAAVNAKVPPAERMEIAKGMMAILYLMGGIRKNSIEWGDAEREEPIDIINWCNRISRKNFKYIETETGVKKRTVQAIVADLRQRIDKWPAV